MQQLLEKMGTAEAPRFRAVANSEQVWHALLSLHSPEFFWFLRYERFERGQSVNSDFC